MLSILNTNRNLAGGCRRIWCDRLDKLRHPTSRSVALQRLLRIEYGGAYTALIGKGPNTVSEKSAGDDDQEEEDALEISIARALDARDRRLVTELVSGVTRWQRKLAWVLINLPKPTKLDSMDAPLRIILLLGAYEILELGLPGHAVSEYVTLAKNVMHEGCGKVTNGVLRSLVRCVESKTVPKVPVPSADASDEEFAALASIAMSHPPWMVKKWIRQFGRQETLKLMRKNNQRPTYSVRLTGLRAITESELAIAENVAQQWNAEYGVSVRPSRYLPSEFLVVESGMQKIISNGLLDQGKAQVQDEAAGLVVSVVDPKPGESILDCCAAPGGKTMFIAARMRYLGRLVAVDLNPARIRALNGMARRQLSAVPDDLGRQRKFSFQCIATDARQYCHNCSQSNDLFDKVLVDAPCSGTGVLAKRADLRWKRQPKDVAELYDLQSTLLDAAAKATRPGGLLIYSTCSIEQEENSYVVYSFLENHPEFALDPITGEEWVTSQGFLTLLPHIHGTDGSFAARLRKLS